MHGITSLSYHSVHWARMFLRKQSEHRTETQLSHRAVSGKGRQRSCEGCDIVQSDHAPQAGVAQGIFDGELVRRRVGHQVEELEEEQDKEVERRVRRDAQRTTQVRMHG